ncbi:MAG: SAM-dependent methyltransferase, partial [Verrucomicrobiales bacterium]
MTKLLLSLLILVIGPVIAEEKSFQPYTEGPKTRDGIGKYYMGREISHVMGHLAAGWLERDERE